MQMGIHIKKKSIFIIVLVLIAGIGVLVLYLPRWVGHTDTKMEKAGFHIMHLIPEKLNEFYREQGRFPSTEEGLKLLTEKTNAMGQPYLRPNFKDPWCNEYHYAYPGVRNKNSYDLWSYGPDNQLGGTEDHTQDITNWE
jgi:general secretion pathway protein G